MINGSPSWWAMIFYCKATIKLLCFSASLHKLTKSARFTDIETKNFQQNPLKIPYGASVFVADVTTQQRIRENFPQANAIPLHNAIDIQDYYDIKSLPGKIYLLRWYISPEYAQSWGRFRCSLCRKSRVISAHSPIYS